MASPITAVFALLLLVLAPQAQGQTDTISADQFMQNVIHNLRENEAKKAATLTYRARHIARRVTTSGKVEHIEEQLEFQNNKPRIISRTIDGKADDIKKSPSKGFDINLRTIFASKYIYEFVDRNPIPIDGRKCFLIEFRPKPDLEFKTREDQVLNRAQGKIFIDQDTLLVWRFEAWLPSEFSVYTYFKVYSANISITFQEIEGVTTEQLITINSHYRNGWWASRKTLTETYAFTDFTRLP
jgi:hypothetical protein